MLEKLRKFFQGPPGPRGQAGEMLTRPYVQMTRCAGCHTFDECVRIARQIHICARCEVKLQQRLKALLTFQ